MKITTEIDIEPEILRDAITDALEGGSNHWYWLGEDACKIIEQYQNEGERLFSEAFFWAAYQADEKIPVRDLENPDEILGYFSRETIARGLQLFSKDYNKLFQSMFKDEDYDALGADVLFQLCVMGEVVFG